MDIQIADGADSLPQEPRVGTGNRQGSNSPSKHLPSSPCSSQPLLHSPPLTHTQAQGWKDSCSRRSSHTLSTASAGKGGSLTWKWHPLILHSRGKEASRGHFYPTTPHPTFSSETSPFLLLLCGFTGLPVLKLATLPCPTLETLHSQFSFPIPPLSFYPFCRAATVIL